MARFQGRAKNGRILALVSQVCKIFGKIAGNGEGSAADCGDLCCFVGDLGDVVGEYALAVGQHALAVGQHSRVVGKQNRAIE